MDKDDMDKDFQQQSDKSPEIPMNTVRCPSCRKEVRFEGNPYRPFCSRGCKGLDLIHWASESYRIEGKLLTEEYDEERS